MDRWAVERNVKFWWITMSDPNTANWKAMASLTMLVNWVLLNERNARIFMKSTPPYYILRLIQVDAKL